jgi:YVTN family beta-propeller protein
MTREYQASHTAGRRRRTAIAGVMLACLTLLSVAPAASAATSTNAWIAKVGSGGANGTARILAYTTGSGSIAMKLAKLKALTTHAVTLRKGSCSGATLLTLGSIKTTSAGAILRTISLTSAQIKTIKNATTGTAKFAIRIGSGSSAKCGVFVAQTVPAYVAAKVTVGPAPSGVVIDAAGVWVTNWWDNTLSRIHPTANSVLNVFPITMDELEGPEAITSGAGSLWVTTVEFDDNDATLPGSILRIEPATGTTLATIPGGRGAYDIAYGAGAVWVPNYDDGAVVRIDPTTNQVVASIPIPYASGIAVDATSVWVINGDGLVSRIDPSTNQVVATVQTQPTGALIAAGANAIWVTHPGTEGTANGSVSRIDPVTNQVVANVPVGESPWELAVAGGSVWVGLDGAPTVVRINATTNTIVSKLAVSTKVYALAATDHAVWVVHNLPSPAGSSDVPPGSVSHIVY